MNVTRVRMLPLLAGVLASAVFNWLACAPVQAGETSWDGTSYLRVPVRLGSDTRLVMPEAFDDAWEREHEVACTLLDAHTLIIRPRVSAIEQRLTLRGRESGTLYLARVSSSLPFEPIVNVENLAVPGELSSGRMQASTLPSSLSSQLQASVLGLLKAMMQGRAPAGYQVQKSQRVLFDQAPYRVVAREVWRSPRQTGILALLTSSVGGQPVPVVPANIVIQIPELGGLRAMAADDFELNANRASTHVYLVYAAS